MEAEGGRKELERERKIQCSKNQKKEILVSERLEAKAITHSNRGKQHTERSNTGRYICGGKFGRKKEVGSRRRREEGCGGREAKAEWLHATRGKRHVMFLSSPS